MQPAHSLRVIRHMADSFMAEAGHPSDRPASVVGPEGVHALICELSAAGFRVAGPIAGEDAIEIGQIEGYEDLPVGVGATQEPGHYRLFSRSDGAAFAWAVGPDSFKRSVLPPRVVAMRATRVGGETRFETPEPTNDRVALFGIRPCDVHALAVLDRVMMGGADVDPDYASRRSNVFIVAVECGEPAGNCFCASMSTGPGIEEGFDVRLTEMVQEEGVSYLAVAGSPAGQRMIDVITANPAEPRDLERARGVVDGARARMGRELDTDGLAERLLANPEHPHWDVIAGKCLACANCTLVCPTCFCTTMVDSSSLDGASATRSRLWDSCFNSGHSEMGGAPHRRTVRARYRQWATHKLASWHAQFGTPGCVGCGRCVTWCPVGIDLTQEVAEIR